MLSIHLPSYISVHALSYSVIMINQFTLIRCSKYWRRLRNNYACLQVLVNNAFTWKSSCVIANNAWFVQGYNLEVHNVIKYTWKHRATVIIECASWFYLCDVISRSQKGYHHLWRWDSHLAKGIKKNKEGERRIKGIAMVQWVNRLRNNIFVNPLLEPYT